MNAPVISLLFALGSGFAFAQTNPALLAMVDAEKAFAKMAKEQNRRDAFLAYLSDDVITSGPNGLLQGKDHIRLQAPADDWLSWEPTYSDIASSGDFGFNSGPWEYRVLKTDAKPIAYGEFNSVWKKQGDGSWKNVLDIGIQHGPPIAAVAWQTSSKTLSPGKRRANPDGFQWLSQLENKFIRSANRNRKAAYRSSLSKEAKIMVTGHLPYTDEDALARYLEETNAPSSVQTFGGEVSASGDLGYVYGTGAVAAGKGEIKKACYLRIWKKEGRKWKIVLDALSFQDPR